MRFSFLSALLAAALPFTAFAAASAPASSADMDYVNLSAGIFNTLHNDSDTTGQAGVEYRFHQWDFGVRPTVGVSANWDGMVYTYGGINWEVALVPNRWLLTPSVMAGYYHQGGAKDLGGPFEFREGIELAYQFDNRQRLGLAFQHMSNAHIYNHNPGVESLLVQYAIPVSNLW